MNDEMLISCAGVTKSYRIGKTSSVAVLSGIDWQIARDSWTALLGASGSGKTTLLNLLGGLEHPDSGTIVVDGIEYAKLSRRQLSEFRGSHLGFVFQSYHLLPELNLLENVMLPAMFARRNAKKEALELLERVGLSGRIHHRPAELSGGEQQRAAIARALINHPNLLLADEPTGNLDGATGESILALFRELHASGLSIVMITHSETVARAAQKVVHLADGRICGSSA